jgi:hypothetical protein
MSQVIEELLEAEVDAAPTTPTEPVEPGAEEPKKVRRAEDLIAEQDDRPLTKEEIIRPCMGALATTLGASFLVGGMFVGYAPRAYAAIGAIVGVAAAAFAAFPSKRPGLRIALSFTAIVAIGFIGLALSDGLGDPSGEIKKAFTDARLHRPPAAFNPGWGAMVPWTLALLGFSAAWIGSIGRKAAIGVLIPIPIIAFAAIAQPAELQIVSGIIAFASFVIGLAVIYRADRGVGEGVSVAYEIKRAVRMLPYLAVLSAALGLLSQAGFLFPDPVYDPTERAQKPKSIPLSEVEDRILFIVETEADVESQFKGPWRQGVLDVIDPEGFWRLPPFNADSLVDVPSDGLIGDDLGHQAVSEAKVNVIVEDLGGTVLPLPSRVQAIKLLHGPKLQLDARTQRVLVKEGSVRDDLRFEAFFSLLPTEEQLLAAPPVADPVFLADFTDAGTLEPPPSVVKLIADARADFQTTWEQLDFVRGFYLATITASGPGLPSPVPPDKVEDMFSGSKEATPYEIVATQALLARWMGVPARIGYGFDGGEEGAVVTERHYRPKHGASWLEVYFQDIGWFPVTGLPHAARPSLDNQDQNDAKVLPGNTIGVSIYVPVRLAPANFVLKQIQAGVMLAMPFILLAVLAYYTVPVVRKARRRGRRRDWALRTGRQERIAVAYADLRDFATDLGVGDPYGTPLGYVQKVVDDEEHRELAWLVTRTLFGDLRDSISDAEVLAAEELSRSLRRRLQEAQPFTIRGVAFVSRLSLRNPYAPELLSPPIEKFDLRRTLRFDRLSLKRKPKYERRHLKLPGFPRRKKESTHDEAVA